MTQLTLLDAEVGAAVPEGVERDEDGQRRLHTLHPYGGGQAVDQGLRAPAGGADKQLVVVVQSALPHARAGPLHTPVSYTHLTLPTTAEV